MNFNVPEKVRSMGQRVAAATKSEGVAPRSGCGGLHRCVSSLLLLMLLTFVDGAEGALAPETTTAHAVACVAAVSASVVEVDKGTRRGGRSKDRFGGRLTWWMLVASFFLAVLGGMAGVEGGSIPDCTYSGSTDQSSHGNFSVPQVAAGGVAILDPLPYDGQAVEMQTKEGAMCRPRHHPSNGSDVLPSSEDDRTTRTVKTIVIRRGHFSVVPQAIAGGVHRTKQRPVDCNANGIHAKVNVRGLKNTKGYFWQVGGAGTSLP